MRDCQRTTGKITAARSLLPMFVFACLIIVVLHGCSTQSRYRIKTILFTGVPPLEQTDGTQQGGLDAQVIAADQVATQQSHRDAMAPQFWAHGPFAASQCDRCHALGQSTSFGAFANTTMASTGGSLNRPTTSRLVIPGNKLCTTCHEQHGRRSVRKRGLVHHRPASTGRCLACHNPHQTQRRYMLRGANDAEMCGQCHDLPLVDPSHADAQDRECTSCHNAHVSEQPGLLESDRSELLLLYGRQL